MTRKRASPDYYGLLGVDPGAELRGIRSNYRRLVRQYHPDRAKNKDAEKRFLAIREAYEVLSNPERRREYDRLTLGPILALRHSGTRATAPGHRMASPAGPSAMRRGFRMLVEARRVCVDPGVGFGGASRGPSTRQARPAHKEDSGRTNRRLVLQISRPDAPIRSPMAHPKRSDGTRARSLLVSEALARSSAQRPRDRSGDSHGLKAGYALVTAAATTLGLLPGLFLWPDPCFSLARFGNSPDCREGAQGRLFQRRHGLIWFWVCQQ